MFLPHITALKPASKSSLTRIRSDVYFAALQPDPIAKPIFA